MPTNPFNPGDKIFAYVRYSGGQEQGLKDRSSKEQAHEIDKFCKENGLILYRVFEDAGISGTSTIGRYHFFEMINFLKQHPKPPIAGVVVWSLSRFARDLNTAQLYKAELRHYGYTIYSLTEQFEDNATGILFETLIDWKNQMYSEEISAHVSRALRNNFELFGVIPGKPPFGYLRVPVQLPSKKDGTPRTGYRFSPDPDIAPLIRMAFEMKANRVENRKIFRAIKIYKNDVSICDMFKRTIYYGSVTYSGVTRETYCEPIVSKELWERANGVRMEAKGKINNRRGKYGPASNGLLAGLLVCGNCGSGMTVNRRISKGREYRSYRCFKCNAKQVPCQKIENALLDKVFTEILTEDHIKHMIDTSENVFSDAVYTAETRKDDTRHQLTSVEQQIERITDAIAKMGLSEALEIKLNELQAIKWELVDQEALYSETIANRKTWLDSAYDKCKYLKNALMDQNVSIVAKQDLLKSFITEIIVFDGNRAIVHYSLPDINHIVGKNSLCPRRTSNPQPCAPQADALSN